MGFLVDLIKHGAARWNGARNGFVDPLTGSDMPVLAGVIIIATPAVSGVAQVIPSQTVTASMNGEKITYEALVRDDFGILTTTDDILDSPGNIYVPPGVRYGRLTLSLAFPAEAASGANGIRWARALQGAGTHKGNSGARPAVADAGNLCSFMSAIVPVSEGEFYWGSAIQNSGSPLTLGGGNASNNYASNWLQMEFFK